MNKKKTISRRAFLASAAASGAACAIVPRNVLGRGFTPPSDMLNIAAVGVGGMGRSNLINLASQNIVALCDVDWRYADKGFDHLDIDIERLKQPLELPPPTMAEPPSSTSGPARLATCAKSTSGRIVRSATGHRACRARNRLSPGPNL